MIPLRDNVAPRRLMPVNAWLIVANFAVFLFEASLGSGARFFIVSHALIPLRLTAWLSGSAVIGFQGASLLSWPPATLVTSMFLHGGFLHVAGNMLYLFIFGKAIENRLGSARFLCFYMASGIAAGLATVWMSPGSQIPVIGASGAVAGILGAYFVLYPGAKILTLVPIFIFIQVIEIPAVLYLLVWFAIQLVSGLGGSLKSAIPGGVAWWAHVGGFLFGMMLGPLLARRSERRPRRIW